MVAMPVLTLGIAVKQIKELAMKANQAEMQEAMEAAYRKAGVAHHWMDGDLYISPKQHNATRTKALAADAVDSLRRRGLDAECSIVRSPIGDAIYGIRLS